MTTLYQAHVDINVLTPPRLSLSLSLSLSPPLPLPLYLSLMQIQKRDKAISQLEEEASELKSHYAASCEEAQTTEKAREALQNEYDRLMEELNSHEQAMADLEAKVEEEEERRAEELDKCTRVIEELKQQLVESEHKRAQQQDKVMVVTHTCSSQPQCVHLWHADYAFTCTCTTIGLEFQAFTSSVVLVRVYIAAHCSQFEF